MKRLHPNSAEAQRQRLIQALMRRPVTTLEARRELDVLHPAARVMELRRQGVPVETHWVIQDNISGRPHRVALYVLMPGQQA